MPYCSNSKTFECDELRARVAELERQRTVLRDALAEAIKYHDIFVICDCIHTRLTNGPDAECDSCKLYREMCHALENTNGGTR